MTIAERKIKLVQKILQSDEETVSRFEEILESEKLDDSTVVAHTMNGRAISLKEYREKNERAVAGYAEGKFRTSEELKNKFRSK